MVWFDDAVRENDAVSEFYLGLDLGGTVIKAVVTDSHGSVLAFEAAGSRPHLSPDKVLELVIATARQVLINGCVDGAPVATGFAVAGLVDMQLGIARRLPNFAYEWEGKDLRRPVEDALGCSVYVINDARAAAWGESRFGAGRGRASMAMLALGTGVGGGFVLDGVLRLGHGCVAGEIGHITVEPNGVLCCCGNRGCLETLVGAASIGRLATLAVEEGQSALMLDLCGRNTSRIDAELVARAAQAGDPAALDIWHTVALYLAIGIANIVVVLDPEVFVIGGGVAQAGHLLFEPLRSELTERLALLGREASACEVVPAALGARSGAIGAAAWSMMQSVAGQPSAV